MSDFTDSDYVRDQAAAWWGEWRLRDEALEAEYLEDLEQRIGYADGCAGAVRPPGPLETWPADYEPSEGNARVEERGS